MMPTMTTPAVERFDVALNTPAGRLTTAIDVSTGFIPITAIIPATRRLGEEASRLEEHRAIKAGQSISCRMGCAACCRMLVPLSAPEAFALHDYLTQLPADQRDRMTGRIRDTTARLRQEGLLDQLQELADSPHALPDDALDPINRAYYALRLPCPFLENEICSIYEARPAACRELLVTSPAELCQDLVNNPVKPLPVSIRIGSVLGLLWATLTNSPPRLIPLPIAVEWAERHHNESVRTWRGTDLFDRVLDTLWRCLAQEFRARGQTPPD